MIQQLQGVSVEIRNLNIKVLWTISCVNNYLWY